MKYLNALYRIPGVGNKTLQKLADHFPEPKFIWEASLSSLLECGLSSKLAESICAQRCNIEPEKEWQKLQDEQIELLTKDSPDYPRLLREIHDPPLLLYRKGRFDLNSTSLVAIVGSRKITPYGQQVADYLARDLVNAGITVVSGMAMGVDTIAHHGALAAHGHTVAVLGNGLTQKDIYPQINLALSREIQQAGALISDYPLDTPASQLTFPARNRIIAGISLATIIVEAEEKSGALITARYALEYNREVMSIPGPIFSPTSIGTNNLIKKGAKLISSVKDVLEELDLSIGLKKPAATPRNPDNKQEELVLAILSHEPIHVDNIIKLTKLKTSDVAATLLLMEMKGWVKNIGGQNYIING